MIKIKNFFSKYWLFVLLTIIATIFGTFYFKNKSIPPIVGNKLLGLPSPQIESYKIPNSVSISLEENNLESPKKDLEVYQASSFVFSDQEAIEIAKRLGFLQLPTVTYNQIRKGNVYTWDDEQKSLIMNLNWGTINYHQKLKNQSPSQINSITLTEGEEIVSKFLESNGFLPNGDISLVKKDLFYIKTSEMGAKKVSSPQEANLIEADFDYKINQKKITNCFIIIAIDFSKQIVNFNYQPAFKGVKILDNYPLKLRDEIMKDLKNKREISYLLTPSSYSPTSEEVKKITSLSFNQIEIAYYKYDPLQSYLQPVFLVTGIANLENNQQAEIGVYLPAIKDQYLLK